MSELNHFSASTLAELQKDEKHPYYVYCLVDPRNNQTFYIGKGKGNRIFAHRQAALSTLRKSDLLEENETSSTLKIKTIQEINRMNLQILSYILSYGLTESEAYASENALILAVKVRDAFNLCKDESKEYPIDDSFRDDNNLKSRTLGNWVIGRDKIHLIRYVIAVNTGADNAVVAAYKVSSQYSESKKFENGRTRYAFQALSKREDTLRELNLYKRSLPDIKFGSGSAIAYINN
ncbi:TPA: hypothetical protein U2L08_000412 [Enterococcus faecium]|jgi:hypothetical protein|uniref:LEM-3-like GIY-YIG domain-containing protein n=1 Tax=Enterococcus faecium TaxID=1352 RepID=UPI00028258FC|nr:hypothetical protein [Enterococcus faecium]EGP5243503.1 hypothetical protein [Enterococcus faecium]EHH1654011.1 hypothetical protein [Enterococcus faecium]EJX50852.1 hypothetical protein HMPREF1380_00717 [Enterococcus faecium R499]EOG11706.1 hypothetical protein SM3_01113 [Enterococcus faecium EnGen0176]EOM42935.1 hypothetical protein SKU_00325 [Enterococcus faecium EnGen0173]